MKTNIAVVLIVLVFASCKPQERIRNINIDLAPDSIVICGTELDKITNEPYECLRMFFKYKVKRISGSLIYTLPFGATQISFSNVLENDTIEENCKWCIPNGNVYPTRRISYEWSPFICDYVKFVGSKKYVLSTDTIQIYKFLDCEYFHSKISMAIDSFIYYSYYLDRFGLISRTSSLDSNHLPHFITWVMHSNSVYFLDSEIKEIEYLLIRDTTFFNINPNGIRKHFGENFLDSLPKARGYTDD